MPENERRNSKTVFELGGLDGGSGKLAVYFDAELEEAADGTTPPYVTIDVAFEHRCDSELNLTLKFTGNLEEDAVVNLISALSKALELSRAAAKERGYYEYRALRAAGLVDENVEDICSAG